MDHELFSKTFWTAARRRWLYQVAVAAVPLMIAIGFLTPDIAQLVLNALAAVLGVGAGAMALTNVTPDNVYKLAIEVPEVDEDGDGDE
ncbi:holin [Pontimonas phage phiPsal1]|nr:holin [Pontimonas phage phiPsal1]